MESTDSVAHIFESTLEQGDWQNRANCRGQWEFFFAPGHFERKDEKHTREDAARAICRACDVRAECLTYALETDQDHGIWGGLNEFERSVLKSRHRASG